MSEVLIRHAFKKIQHYYVALGIRGVVLFIWARISRTEPRCRVDIPGLRHPVVVRIGTTDVSVLRQVLFDRHYDVALPFRPAHVIDAGANIGLAAVFFANKYPESEIIAVEPDESNVRLLRENSKPYPNIHVIQGALWNKEGELSLVDPGSGHHGFQTSETVNSADINRVAVQSYTVDALMRRMNWPRLDILKLDVEGAEKEVLESCDRWISSTEAFMVELHEAIKPGCVTAFERATVDFRHRTTKGEALIVWRSRAVLRSGSSAQSSSK